MFTQCLLRNQILRFKVNCNKQNFKVKSQTDNFERMLSNSMFLPSQRQYLQQKVCILEDQLQEYKQKQSKLNRLNESILQTYKLNETTRESREDKLQKQNREIQSKHREELRKIKSQFSKEKLQLQNENMTLKQKLRKLEECLEQSKLQGEKNLLDMKSTLQLKNSKHIMELEKQFNQKITILNQSLDQLTQTNALYKEYIQRKQFESQNILKGDKLKFKPQQYQGQIRNQNKENNWMYSLDPMDRPKPKLIKKLSFQQANYNQAAIQHENLYQIKESNVVAKTVAKSSKKLINELSTRINRAMKEINEVKNERHY